MTELLLWVLGLPFGGPYGGRDAHGTSFTARTDFWLDKLPLPLVFRHHALGDNVPRIIGRAVRYERRADGIWFEVWLPDSPENRELVREAQAGTLRASSGAISHLVRPLPPTTGEIAVWPVAEISLVRTSQGERPSNPYAVALAQVRAIYQTIREEFSMWVWNAQLYRYEWVGEGQPTSAAPTTPPAPQAAPYQAPPVYVSQPQQAQPAPAPQPAPQQPQAPDLGQQLQQMEQQMAALRTAINTPRPQMPTPAIIEERGEPELWHNGCTFTNAIRALQRGQFDRVVFELIASDVLLDEQGQPMSNIRTMSSVLDSTGGYLVPTEHVSKFIDRLMAKTAVRKAGGTIWPMGSLKLEVPRKTAGATAYWVGENTAITASDPTLGMAYLNARKLTALTKFPRELLHFSNPQVENLVQRDLSEVIALAEDDKALDGNGSQNVPQGLTYIDGVNVDTTTLGANGSTFDFDDASLMVYNLDADNAPEEGRAWIMHPRTLKGLRELKRNSEANNYAFVDPANQKDIPTLWGYPIHTTTQITIAETQGASSTASRVYLGAWGMFMIGQARTLELAISEQAGSSFENDQVFVRGIEYVDFNVEQTGAFEVMKGAL